MAEPSNLKYTDKYDVEGQTFPEDLFGHAEKYGNSWMMININTQETTKFSDMYEYIDTAKTPVENKNFSNTRNVPQTTGVGAAATVTASSGVAGGVIGGVMGLRDLLSGKGTGKQAAASAATGAGRGLAAGAFAAIPLLAGSGRRETKRINTAIMLPMPNNLSTGYSMEWGEDSTAMLNAALRLPGSAMDAIKGAFTGDMSAMVKAGGEGADAAVGTSLGAQNALGAGAMSAQSGLASNPKKEMIFSGVGFRNFSLEYKFYPKSMAESARLLGIISTLKFHMHPEYKSEGRYTFVYPSEFDITFYNADAENMWINKIATCVLKNIQVQYTPDGLWAQHAGGAPNALSLTMQFQELSILTKETVKMGY